MAPRARSASCSTPPKSPIILDDGASHDEVATSVAASPSLQDESAASSDRTARRKRSLSADSLDKAAAAAAAAQVDPLVTAVQAQRGLCVAPLSPLPPPPPPSSASSDTPWKSVTTPSASLPTPLVAISAPPTTIPAPVQHQHRSAYPISSAAAGFVQDAPAPQVYQSPYSFVAYDLSPGFLPLPPSSSTTATGLSSVAPFSSSPSDGLPEQYPPDTFPSFPVPTTMTLYYPIPREPNQLLPSAGYPLPPPASSRSMETYLPSPPLSLHDAAIFQPAHGQLHFAAGPGPIGQQQQPPMPWPTAPTRSPPRLLANGLAYPISSSAPFPRAEHFDPGAQGRGAPAPPNDLWSKGALASFGATATTTTAKRFETSPTSTTTATTTGDHGGGGGSRRRVHEHGSPDCSVLRQQIQAGEHPRSRGTCKFFNPQTGFGYIIDDRADELATDVFVHFTGIEQSRGFRCLSPGERVEYILTQNSAGRVQALKVVGENGAQLLGLADPVQANRVRDAARRLSPTIDSGASDSSSSPSSLSGGARSRKPRVVPIPPSKLMAPIMAGSTNALGLIEPVHSD